MKGRLIEWKDAFFFTYLSEAREGSPVSLSQTVEVERALTLDKTCLET